MSDSNQQFRINEILIQDLKDMYLGKIIYTQDLRYMYLGKIIYASIAAVSLLINVILLYLLLS